MEKGEPLALLVGMQAVTATLENSVGKKNKRKHCGGSLKLKIELPYDPAIALLGIYPKDTDAVKHQDTCTPAFIAAMSTIAKLWKEPQCPTKDEWIKKMLYTYEMEYYSAI